MITGTGRGPQTRRSALHQYRGNKARMSMKTNSREVEKSRSRGVVKPDQEVRRGDAYGLSLFDFQLSTLNCLTRIRRNKARMSMKTKDEVKKSREIPHPARCSRHPLPQRSLCDDPLILSFRGVTGDEESRTALKILRARFFASLRMTVLRRCHTDSRGEGFLTASFSTAARSNRELREKLQKPWERTK